MLTFEGATMRQGHFTLVADFTIGTSVTAIIGPSGGGKSTLLAAVAGFLRPLRGRLIWNGQDLTPMSPGERPVAMLFQDNNVFPHLTVAQNVGLGLRSDLRMSARDHVAVAKAIGRVGLEDFANRKPASLSGGQQSRVALARVMVSDRPLVLLDEPFAALDPALKGEMLALIRDMLVPSGKTILMVTHDPQDAKRIAGETVLIADGVAQPPVETAAFFAQPSTALQKYIGG